MPDKFENGTNVLRPHMKTDKMFCVHTIAFLGGFLHSIFGSFSLKRFFLVILKFFPILQGQQVRLRSCPTTHSFCQSNPELYPLARPDSVALFL